MILVAAFILFGTLIQLTLMQIEHRKEVRRYKEEQEKNQDGINWNEGV